MRITGFNARGSYGVGLGLMALLAATGALSLGASGNVPRLKAQPPVDGSARTSDGVFFARSSLPTSTIGTSGERDMQPSTNPAGAAATDPPEQTETGVVLGAGHAIENASAVEGCCKTGTGACWAQGGSCPAGSTPTSCPCLQ